MNLSTTLLWRVPPTSQTQAQGRLFKRATGISPHQYVIKQRVERAKLLLTTTDLAIAKIALQVEFSSQSHLAQHFKRLTGITPKQVSKTTRI